MTDADKLTLDERTIVLRLVQEEESRVDRMGAENVDPFYVSAYRTQLTRIRRRMVDLHVHLGTQPGP